MPQSLRGTRTLPSSASPQGSEGRAQPPKCSWCPQSLLPCAQDYPTVLCPAKFWGTPHRAVLCPRAAPSHRGFPCGQLQLPKLQHAPVVPAMPPALDKRSSAPSCSHQQPSDAPSLPGVSGSCPEPPNTQSRHPWSPHGPSADPGWARMSGVAGCCLAVLQPNRKTTKDKKTTNSNTPAH